MKILLSITSLIVATTFGVYYYNTVESNDLSTFSKGVPDHAPVSDKRATINRNNNDDDIKTTVMNKQPKAVISHQKQVKLESKQDTDLYRKYLVDLKHFKMEQDKINLNIENLEKNLQDESIKNALVDELKNATSYRANILRKAKEEMNINNQK